MTEVQRLLKQAEEASKNTESWADFSNFLYDQKSGILAQAFKTPAERARFSKTKECKRIRELFLDSMNRHGLVEGATPKKSGRFVVRVPVTLHAMLENEAMEEGVSLNQLVVFKLAAQLKHPLVATKNKKRAS